MVGWRGSFILTKAKAHRQRIEKNVSANGCFRRGGEMRSIRLVVLASLRRRRMQTLLIALSIAVSTMALSTAIATLLGVSAPVDETFDRLRASHLLMLF